MKLSTLKYSVLFIGLIGINALTFQAQEPTDQPVNVIEKGVFEVQPTEI